MLAVDIKYHHVACRPGLITACLGFIASCPKSVSTWPFIEENIILGSLFMPDFRTEESSDCWSNIEYCFHFPSAQLLSPYIWEMDS